jgi:uncharacterized phage protein gp47/JayE
MAYKIPTSEEIFNTFLANFETYLNENVPPQDQAFIRVLTAQEALVAVNQYKYVADRALQNFVLTSFDDDLDRIGTQYGVVRKPSEAAVLQIYQFVTSGTTVLATVSYTGNSNGVVYRPDSDQTAGASNTITSLVTATTTGIVGTLAIGDVVTMGVEVPGANSTAVVTAIDTEGTEKESDEAYQQRILTEIRTPGGGSTSADYRKWANQTPGVFQSYPYSGIVAEEITVYFSAEYQGVTAVPTVTADIVAWANSNYADGEDVTWSDVYAYANSQYPGDFTNSALAWDFSTTPPIPGDGEGVDTIVIDSGQIAKFDTTRVILYGVG